MLSAMVVPGSGLVKQQAEEEGIDKIFKEAGFEWREPGCSMCLAMNSMTNSIQKRDVPLLQTEILKGGKAAGEELT